MKFVHHCIYIGIILVIVTVIVFLDRHSIQNSDEPVILIKAPEFVKTETNRISKISSFGRVEQVNYESILKLIGQYKYPEYSAFT